MIKYIAAYAAAAVVMLALDLLWLGVVARSTYLQGIGHLMADQPVIPVAILFYALFPVGLMVFAIAPHGVPGDWGRTLLSAGLFGFFCYATYDLTNLATLKGWPATVSLLDMAWGVVVSVAAASAGKVALDRFTGG